MPVGDSLIYAFFCMLIVFIVLIMLWVVIKAFSAFICFVEKQQKK